MNDTGAAIWYQSQADLISSRLEEFWDPIDLIVKTTMNISENGRPTKISNLDVSVLLAILHCDAANSSYSIHNDKILSTLSKLERIMYELYPINQNLTITLIGRYPEDIYDGVGLSSGNPWVLATHAFAEHSYLLADYYFTQKSINITKISLPFFVNLIKDLPISIEDQGIVLEEGSKLFKFIVGNLTMRGDLILETLYTLVGNGSYPEQINKETGALQGARNLSWSESSFITAIRAKPKLMLSGL